MSGLGDGLRELRAPGEDEARRRAWETASAAVPPADTAARSRRRAVLATAAAVVAAAGISVAAVSPAGSAVTDWVGDAVRDVVQEDPPPRAAELGELPGGGRVLVLSGAPVAEPVPVHGSSWIAGDAGPERLLGAVREATWSPGGRFVAATRGSELIAVDLRGRRRWSASADGEVGGPRWSPDGFRVAYLVAGGRELRVLAGDGQDDRRLTTDVHPVAPAWRPNVVRHTLAFARERRVVVLDADTGAVAYRAPAPRKLTGLAFSPDGQRLLLAGRRELRILHARSYPGTKVRAGSIFARYFAPADNRYEQALWSRGGQRVAVVRRTGRRSEVILLDGRSPQTRPRRLFAAGELGELAFSPDGRWLLVDWRETGGWLFLPLDGGRARQIADVDQHFAGDGDTRLVGWCCPPSG